MLGEEEGIKTNMRDVRRCREGDEGRNLEDRVASRLLLHGIVVEAIGGNAAEYICLDRFVHGHGHRQREVCVRG